MYSVMGWEWEWEWGMVMIGMMVEDGGYRKWVTCWCGKGAGNMCECVITSVYVLGHKGYEMGNGGRYVDGDCRWMGGWKRGGGERWEMLLMEEGNQWRWATSLPRQVSVSPRRSAGRERVNLCIIVMLYKSNSLGEMVVGDENEQTNERMKREAKGGVLGGNDLYLPLTPKQKISSQAVWVYQGQKYRQST